MTAGVMGLPSSSSIALFEPIDGVPISRESIAIVLSETTSNTASANMVGPVVIAFVRSWGIDSVLPAIAATMGAALGLMLPVATPCNTIVYGFH